MSGGWSGVASDDAVSEAGGLVVKDEVNEGWGDPEN